MTFTTSTSSTTSTTPTTTLSTVTKVSTHRNHYDEEEESGDYYFEEDSPDTHNNKDAQDEHIDNEHNAEASHDEHSVEDSHDEHNVEDRHEEHNNEDGHDEYTAEDDHDNQKEHNTSEILEDVDRDYEDSDNSLKTGPHGEHVEAGSGARFDDEDESGVTPGLVPDTSDDEDWVDGSGSEQAEDTSDMVEGGRDGAEDRREDLSEEETRARSEFFSLHGLDPLSLDMSCMETFVSGEPRVWRWSCELVGAFSVIVKSSGTFG